MRLRGTALVAALVVGAAWTGLGPTAPAGAAVTVSSAGTTVTITTTAGSAATVTCNGGQVRAQGIAATPAMACNRVTAITINGDAGNNLINVEAVGEAFTQLRDITISPGGGSNVVLGSPARDSVLGTNGGQDQVWLPATGAPDGTINLGGNSNDTVNVGGTDANDRFTVASGSPASRTNVTRGTWTATIIGARHLGIIGAEGDDTLDATGLGTAAIVGLAALGGPGNDTLRGGAPASTMFGGPGRNTMVGGANADVFVTEGSKDTIEGRGGSDLIHDQGAGPVGDRNVVAASTETDQWIVHTDGDAAIRSRSRNPTSGRVTATLARSGVQDLGPGVASITYETDGAGLPADRVLFDIAALPKQSQRITSTSPGTVVDLVVPTGSWTRTGSTVSFSGPYQDVVVGTNTVVSIRAPFTDPEERFAHRVLRDLEMRIPSALERTTYRNQLETRVITRDGLVARLTSTDSYRGLAVDRAFIDILRRGTDSAGRTYWVQRLAGGLSIRRMRANLYGSNEYTAVHGGGTVAGYITAAYRDILGRTPDAAGLEYWIGLVAAGTARGTVADRFLNTHEARTVIVRDQFLRFADRQPTSQEISGWSERMSTSRGDGELELIRSLAASNTYFDRVDI